MRVLFVHSVLGHLGDKIRVTKVYYFLKKAGLQVYEEWVNTRKYMAFVYGLKHVRPALVNTKKVDVTNTKSVLGILASSFFSSIQQEVLQKAIKIQPDVIVAEGSLVGYLCLTARNKLNIPIITDVHGLIGYESKLKESRFAGILSKIEKITFHESDYLLTVSRSMKRQICLKLNIQADKVLAVPNGGDVQRFQARFSLPLNVIYAGNFAVYEKVLDYLEVAKAVEGTSSLVFFLMGDGIQKREILSRITKEKIPIRFMGSKTRQEALRIFSQMQVGVVTATRSDVFPIKLLDYMSCGLPVVAAKIGDMGELIERENCGIAIKESSVTEFVKALNSLRDQEEWTRKSRNGKKCIEREYSWDLVLKPLGSLLERIAA